MTGRVDRATRERFWERELSTLAQIREILHRHRGDDGPVEIEPEDLARVVGVRPETLRHMVIEFTAQVSGVRVLRDGRSRVVGFRAYVTKWPAIAQAAGPSQEELLERVAVLEEQVRELGGRP